MTRERFARLVEEALQEIPKRFRDAMTNVAFAPFYAVAVVLLTVDLIHRRDGAGPPLHSEPARA